MKDRPNDVLLLAGKVLTILMQGAIAIGGVIVALLIPIVVIFRGDIMQGFIDGSQIDISAFPLAPFVGLLMLILAAVAALFVFFGKLRAIIGTVGEGDPFVPENANRLNLMAWLMLGLQILGIPIMGLVMLIVSWADEVGNADANIDAGVDLTGILMVIILFILARVFKHGAEMREDLEGTV
ncbi:MAG: DUF2975 domain-containing protein [Pseudomonadota bacterium]